MQRPIRILFLIPSLVAHGAERQLTELASHMDPRRFEVHVAAFYGPQATQGEHYWNDLRMVSAVTLHDLRKRRGAIHYPTAMFRLHRLVRRIGPDVLHGYMDGNLAMSLAGLLSAKPVIWGIRGSCRDLSKLDRVSLFLMRVEKHLAKSAAMVIFNSDSGRSSHLEMGMEPRQALVIPNGFNTERFAPDPEAGAIQRTLWGVPGAAPLIGIVGRLHPVKDHHTFLKAAALVKRKLPMARFVCVGEGQRGYRDALKATAEHLGLGDVTIWPGSSSNMRGVYSALSVLVLTSTDEGFPNVLGEAMACGTPCVSTCAGDAAKLVGGTGRIHPVGDAESLAESICSLVLEQEHERASRSHACRQRICSDFSVSALARRTEDAITALLAPRPAPEPPCGHRLHH